MLRRRFLANPVHAESHFPSAPTRCHRTLLAKQIRPQSWLQDCGLSRFYDPLKTMRLRKVRVNGHLALYDDFRRGGSGARPRAPRLSGVGCQRSTSATVYCAWYGAVEISNMECGPPAG